MKSKYNFLKILKNPGKFFPAYSDVSAIFKIVVPVYDYSEKEPDLDVLMPDKFMTSDDEKIYEELSAVYWKLNRKNDMLFKLEDEDRELIKKFHIAVVASLTRAFYDKILANYVFDQDCHVFYKIVVSGIRDYDIKTKELRDFCISSNDENIKYWWSKFYYVPKIVDLNALV